MVQRVTVSPSEVRGYGDIVSPKTTEDFMEYMCELSESDGVYTMVYDDTATYLTLSASPTIITYGESTVLTATLTVEGEKASGEIVYFYEGETLLGSDETDNNGVATLTKSNFSISSHSVKAIYDEIESNTVNVVVNKVIPTITLSTDKTASLIGDTFTLSGTFSLTSGTVKLYDGNTFIEDLTVTGGAFSKTITNAQSGSHSYKVVYEGSATSESVTSSTVSVDVVEECFEMGITGSSFRSDSNTPFIYTGKVFVDWGDNTGFVEYTGGKLIHIYSSSGNYAVKIYGEITSLGESCFMGCTGLTSITIPDTVTSIGDVCFYGCTGLTSITIPDTVTSIGDVCFYECTGLTSITIPDTVTNLGGYCFKNCTGLTEIALEWDTSSEILTYDNGWIDSCTSFDHFLIPEGTKSLYTAKNYPSALLKEDGVEPASISLTGTKSILSYADSESSVLTATVLDDNDDPVEGATVELYKDNVLWDTLTTSSAGTVSKTYTSLGAGDVSFKAECGSLVTETYDILDTKWYDNPTSTGVSKYTANGSATITYDSINEAYSLKITSDSLSTVTLNNYRFDTDVTLKADIMFTGGVNKQMGIGLLNGNVGASAKITHATNVNYYGMAVIENTRTSYGSGEVGEALTSSDIVINHWYTLEITYNGSDIVYKLYDGNTVLKSITTSKSVLSNSNELALLVGLSKNSQASFKNIRVL